MLIFDIETNGLLATATNIWCCVIFDTETKQVAVYRPDEIAGAVARLNGKSLCGHNITAFDIPMLQKFFPEFKPGNVWDTMVVGRLLWPTIGETDYARTKDNRLPAKLIGSHSLKAYGYRLGELKGEFGETTDWSEYSDEMLEYCKQDVHVTYLLHLKEATLLNGGKHTPAIGNEAFSIEHEVARIVGKQMEAGFLFDMERAQKLSETLITQRAALVSKLRDIFPPWRDVKRTFVPKRDNKRLGYTKGVPVTIMQDVTFNPDSAAHCVKKLKERYGWVPTEFTPSGQPQFDDAILRDLPYPEAQVLGEYYLIQKRLGMLSEGKAAWMSSVSPLDGRIHGYVNTNGAVTGRMSHSRPNMAQVPKEKVYRELFLPTPGMKLVGIDASGLELRCLAHYLGFSDKKEFAHELLNGDIHTRNQKTLGLATRDIAKTFIYAFIYGAGDEKIGGIAGGGISTGKKIRDAFYQANPMFKRLHDSVVARMRIKEPEKRFLVAIDGRIVYPRSQHSALNTLLQGCGAILMKKALVLLEEKLTVEYKLKWGRDFNIVGNIHDEWQIEALPQYAEMIGQAGVSAIEEAGLYFNLNCPLTGEFKIGNNWSETH